MMFSDFLIKPNLPTNKVCLCAISNSAVEAVSELEALGVNCLPVEKNNKSDYEISSHADIELLHLGKNNFLISGFQQNLKKKLIDEGSNIIKTVHVCSPYPNDVILNKLIIENKIIGNFSSCCFDNNSLNYDLIPVKQGYTKCSSLVVDEASIITDDEGIARLLKNCQFDVLLINKGDIKLSEKHYGFFGGCCCKIDKNLIYFNGNIEKHKSFELIKSFLDKRNIEMVYNTQRALTDFGGTVSIKQLI